MMRRAQEGLARLLATFRKRTWDRELDEELAAHVDLLTQRNEQRGMAPDEARRRALQQMGGLTAASTLHREARGLPRVEAVASAVAQAWRSWRSAKAVALLAATALAVGIGSATAIYTVVDGVMMKPLPYRDGERFVAVFAADTADPQRVGPFSYRDAEEYERRTAAFDAFGWFRGTGKNLVYGGEPHHVPGIAVTPALVQQLGAEPMLGRWFEDESGVVISNALWRRLGADPHIVGQGLTLDLRAYTITGVMPASFHFPVTGQTAAEDRVDIWTALEVAERGGCCYDVYARRRPDATFAAAAADVARVAAEIAAETPQRRATYTVRVVDLRETVVRRIRPTLLLLFAAAGLLFLIACASAAGLLLSRSVARARETAMRVALGARRGQLAVHYVAEGLLVALAGAAGGIGLSVVLTPAIVALAADYLPRADEIGVNWTVLLFALGIACVAGVLSSLAPLRQAARTTPVEVLGEGVRVSAGHHSRRASRLLVISEIALAFGLLAVSAVLIDHVRGLARTSPGFDPNGVLTFVLSVPGTIADDPQQRVPHQRRLLEAIGAIPGVDAVAFANQLPLKACCRETTVFPDGGPSDVDVVQRTSLLMAVSPGYFETMRIPLRSGRLLTELDVHPDHRQGTSDASPPRDVPVVVNQAAAQRYWRERDPIGAYGTFDGPTGQRFQVVGVVGNVKNVGLDVPTAPEVYALAFPYRIESMFVVVRSARPAASLLPDVRQAAQGVDPQQPVHAVATMPDVILSTMTLERALSFLTTFFAGAALLMAALGVYGVIAYAVKQRTMEIGMRMMLGASSRDVLGLVLGDGLTLAAYGIVAGGAAAAGGVYVLARIFETVTIGVAPFIYSTTIVVALAFVASFVPALRAALLSPLVVLRGRS